MNFADNIPHVDDDGRPKRPLPAIQDAAELQHADIATPPLVISGLLHRGSKFVLGGSSKSKKTFTLLDMGLSVATGQDWLGLRTQQSPVLYINFEIQEPFFWQRVQAICGSRKIKLEPGDFRAWNLRGHAAPAKEICPAIIDGIKQTEFGLIIVDPIYKCLGDADENSSRDMSKLMNELEHVGVSTGAAVAFGAHFSKGNQAAKESMDRISGSGVFARDPDSIMIMTAHKEPNAFAVEFTLRNLPPLDPFCVRWEYPNMSLAHLDPRDLKEQGKSKRPIPSDEEALAFFPKRFSKNDPRAGLLNAKQLEEIFDGHRYDKNEVKTIRERLAAKGEISVVQGLQANEKLAGLPHIADAYERWREKLKKERRAARLN